MTDPNASSNRILVALDTSERGRAALRAAVQLAMSTRAELEGLFVEDEDLLRLASLPFSREIDLTSAAARELQAVAMERALHVAAREARQAFTSALNDVNLRSTFRVVRGTVINASLAAAGDACLLVIGQRGRYPRLMVRERLGHSVSGSNRVVAIFDGSPAAYRTLEIASSLAASTRVPLSVLVVSGNGDAVTQQCLEWLAQQDVTSDVDQVLNPSDSSLVEYVKKWPPDVLCINRDSRLLNDLVIRQFVNEFDGPLILT